MHICIFFLTFYSYTSSSIYVSNYLSTYLSFIWFSLSKCLFMSCQIRLNPTLARTVCYQIWSREMTQNDHWSFLTTWNLEWKRTPLFSYKGVYCLEARPTIHLLPEGGSGEGVLHALTLGSPSALVYLLSLSLRFLSAWEIISRLEMKGQRVGNIHLLSLLIPFPVWKKEKSYAFTYRCIHLSF